MLIINCKGQFAVESVVNELAHKIGMDPVKIREINMLREGKNMPAYYNETNNACAFDRCLERAKQMSK
jgi:CO/xanthine dehydrogenase Mo-binding subunit